MLQRIVGLYLNCRATRNIAKERDAASGAGFIEWPAMRVAWGKVWRATKIVLAVFVIGGRAWHVAQNLRQAGHWVKAHEARVSRFLACVCGVGTDACSLVLILFVFIR